MLVDSVRKAAESADDAAYEFAMTMPVEFYAEYVHRRSDRLLDVLLAKLLQAPTGARARDYLSTLKTYHEWFEDRAQAYCWPLLEELSSMLNKVRERFPEGYGFAPALKTARAEVTASR